jgi:hypothetical protein
MRRKMPGRAIVMTLRRLWAGELPLATAFWTCAIIWGTALNLAATVAALALLAAGAPAVLAVALAALPIPFNFLVLFAVWRSARAYQGPRLWADLARVLSLLWAVVATAT